MPKSEGIAKKNCNIKRIPGSNPNLLETATYPRSGGILPGIAPMKTAMDDFFEGV